MNCANCGTANPDEARFCLECGTAFAPRCPTCGATNPAAAKFCGTCGTRLAMPAPATSPSPTAGPSPTEPPGTVATGTQPAAAAAGGTERRMVSVLFADLVGFTALSSTRDPEAMRELQARYFERATEIVERYGGAVEKFIGDALMAVWGAPVAHEDDAERAVRAALDLVDAVPALGREAEVELELRAGVLTGEAAVAVGAVNQGMVTGDMVNTASRLQSVAPPGQVFVGERTRLATANAIAYEDAGRHELKGKGSVPAWRALRVLGERGGARRPDALEPPFVGRADELRFLKEQFHATGREKRTRLISLVGQAGIGKSRLAWELEKYVDGVVEPVWWNRGRSPSYGEGITFWALGEMVRARAGLAEGDDEETTRRLIATMLGRTVRDETERAWIEPRLLALLGVGEGVSGGREELFAAWRTYFERLAEVGTVAIVIEDVQWSDDGLLDFVEHLIDWARSSPILVITLARPELLERRPGWGTDRRGAISMRLEPLSDDSIREMLAGIAPGLPETSLRRIVERADGVPLYAVETVRMLIASGKLTREGDHVAVSGDLAELDVPPTLHALVAARLDGLAPADRELLQDAAVLGQSFATPAVAAMTGESPEALAPRLASLVRREILTIETDPRAPTRGQHAFVQALVREVAYGTLSKRERRAKHLTAARYFETLEEEELAGAVATHFLAAYRAAPEGPEGEAVAAQARIALTATADRAEALGALAQAIDALRSAIDVTRDPADRARILERIGFIATSVPRIAEAEEVLAEARRIYEELGDRRGVVRAVAGHVTALLAPGRIAEAVELAGSFESEAVAMAEASSWAGGTSAGGAASDPVAGEAAALFAEAYGRAVFRLGRFEDAVVWSDRALRLAEPLRLDHVIGQALVTKGTSLLWAFRPREGVALLEGALLDARANGEHVVALRAANNLSSQMTLTDPRAGFERIVDALELAHRLGLRTFDSYLAGNLAGCAERIGEWARGTTILTEIAEAAQETAIGDWLTSVVDFAGPWIGEANVGLVERLLDVARRDEDTQSEFNLLSWLARWEFINGSIEHGESYADAYFAIGSSVADWTTFARIALHTGDAAAARRAVSAFGTAIGGAADGDVATIEAGIATLEGRTADAISGYRTALARYRDFGCRFDLALAVFDMLVLLGPDEPAVASAIDEARATLVELGANALLERFDAAVAGGERGGRGVERRRTTVAGLAGSGRSNPGAVAGGVSPPEPAVTDQ